MVVLSNALIHMSTFLGENFRVRYYTATAGSVWDDERTITQSGTDLYVSGIFTQLDNNKGSSDEVLREAGRIKYNDSVFWVNGSVQTTSGNLIFTMSRSGLDTTYREILAGVNAPPVAGNTIVKKVYVRLIQLGSLF